MLLKKNGKKALKTLKVFRYINKVLGVRNLKVVSIIPARFGSTRFPGKPLAKINGRPMIQHVYEQVSKATKVDEVIIATDNEQIVKEVESFNGVASITQTNHESGSDRIAEVASNSDGDIFLNIQGDEPLISPILLDNLVEEAEENLDSVITAKTQIAKENDIYDPNIVKVITNDINDAIYFSRLPLPYNRAEMDISYYKHLGVYCYPRNILEKFVKLTKSKLEKIEMLEQLRLLENGYNLKVIETTYDAVGVDTPEDIIKVEKVLEEMK